MEWIDTRIKDCHNRAVTRPVLFKSFAKINDLSLILRSTLGGLSRSAGDVAFNLIFHTSSEKKTTKQIHWHIEVYPRISDWAALERGVGIFVNETSPEDAAEILQRDCKKELAEVLGIS